MNSCENEPTNCRTRYGGRLAEEPSKKTWFEVKGDHSADTLYSHYFEGRLIPQTREAIGSCIAMDPIMERPHPPSHAEPLVRMLHFKWNSPEKLRELLNEMTDHRPIDHTEAEAICHSIKPQSRGQ